MKKNKILLSSGLLISVLVSFVFLKISGADNLGVGILWGAVLAYFGFTVYAVMIPKEINKEKPSFMVEYMVGSFVRIILLVSALCAILFWMHVHSLGVMIGSFAGLIFFTFVGLFKMKANVTTTTKS